MFGVDGTRYSFLLLQVSTTFDPFMYLSLPLPIHKKKRIKFIYVPFSPSSRTQQLSLEVPNKMTIDQFRDKVAEKTNSKIGASVSMVFCRGYGLVY